MLSSINTMLTDNFGPFGPLLVVGLLGLFLVLGTLPILLNKKEDPLDRLKKDQKAIRNGQEPEQRLRTDTKNDKLEKYSDFLEPKDAEEYSAVKLKLVQAGYRTKSAVRIYHFLQFALGVLFLLGGVAYAIYQSATGDPTPTKLVMSMSKKSKV